MLVYAAFPTRNHYWDGIAFALNIEEACENAVPVLSNEPPPRRLSRISFYPNHLFYNLFGCSIYTLVHYLAPNVRALRVLQAVSMLASVASACIVFLMLRRWSCDLRLSLWLTLMMAFSATWWKFSTDANVYVASVFLLVLCTFLLSDPRKPPPAVALALLHALSMLFHQIAIFFFPAAAVAIWCHPFWTNTRQRRRAVFAYTIAAGVSVAAAYLWVWFGVLDREWSTLNFLAWLATNGTETLSRRSPIAGLLESLRSSIRVFFGGRISLALGFVEKPVQPLMTAVMLAALTCLFWTLAKHLRTGAVRRCRRSLQSTPSTTFFFIWAAGFSLFLSIWLTEYPYYRLFYLPALIQLLALLLRADVTVAPSGESPSLMPRLFPRHALPAFVLFLAAFNFTFYIYPYSKIESTPPRRLAADAKAIWNPGALVFYKEFTCDNWILKYFNPQTNWRRIDFEDHEAVADHVREGLESGRGVWLDTTALGHLASAPELLVRLQKFAKLSDPWGISDSKHHIQFAELFPHRFANADTSGRAEEFSGPAGR